MALAIASNLFSDNVKVLKGEVSKTAYQGVMIAVASLFIATCLVSFYTLGQISLEGVMLAQRENVALWLLDAIPFIFGIWGQYSSSIIAYQAGAIIFDQTQELRQKADNLEKATQYFHTHDPLTDLPNRALFYDRVEREILLAINQNRILTILLIEIENFKDIYDTLGRNSSDLILKQIAKRLQGVSRDRDSLAKIDGNVFGMLLADNAGFTQSEQLARAIQNAMEPPYAVERLRIAVHANIGIVHFPIHGDEVDTLVQRAGVAIHRAQDSNQGYAAYDACFDGNSAQRLTLTSDLKQAIERGGLQLAYQAKVSIRTGKLYGAEALLRWNHPKYGNISPEEFVPMAERSRMMKELSIWVLKQAFQDCALWHKQGLDLKISVNLSAKDLQDPELPDYIAGIAAAKEIQPNWIMLEITESTVMHDPESALGIIERLHGMGYEFSIDDFGTGYSSLSYLKRMPLTELKIDKSFVMDILHNENDAVIVRAIINLAHTLGLQVTAEGVESAQILAVLKEYGCDIAQGYYLNKPLSVAQFNQWLQTESKSYATPTD
jgi:diguanylate cyclase (GGDEF)-like protein